MIIRLEKPLIKSCTGQVGFCGIFRQFMWLEVDSLSK